ncbi:MAG: HDOD domain-containing protein, partial [Desulfobacterales bacterium]|nr:HDOD domain-containing protein [Desulfobacterales bacterium]
TLPRTVMKITELVNNPKSSARALAGVLTDDQVLTARLLRLVNSSFYGFPHKVSTVTNAIVLLGFDAIRNLLLTTSVFDVFSQKNPEESALQEKMWDHSLGCAVGAKIIGGFLRHDKLEELFVAGLLHDIGKTVEMLFFPDEYVKIAAMVEESNILMVTAEEEVLGYNHTLIGKLLAGRWNLPAKLITAIANHHRPEIAGQHRTEAAVVHLADILCRALDMGFGGDNRMPALNPAAWEALPLSEESIEPIMEAMEKEFQSIRGFMDPPAAGE